MEYKGKAAMFIEFPFIAGRIKTFSPDNVIDYEKLVNYIEDKFSIKIHTKTFYVAKYTKKGDFIFRLSEKLSHLGFSIKTKEPVSYKDVETGEIKLKCNFDSQISLEMHKLALLGRVDYIILGGADIDYIDVLQEVHELGVHTVVLGFQNTNFEIRSIADDFIDISDIINKVSMSKKVYKENGKESVIKENRDKEEKIKKQADEYSRWYA